MEHYTFAAPTDLFTSRQTQEVVGNPRMVTLAYKHKPMDFIFRVLLFMHLALMMEYQLPPITDRRGTVRNFLSLLLQLPEMGKALFLNLKARIFSNQLTEEILGLLL